MSTITNLAAKDPFAEGDDELAVDGGNKVHIRIQKRNGRKSVTTVQGLPQGIDFNRILRVLKKNLNCNGTVNEDETAGKVLQLQGDQRQSILDFLVNEEIVKRENVVLHGY
eukprot:ANDGO_07043.mRNA.1 Protein translation factor SUI1